MAAADAGSAPTCAQGSTKHHVDFEDGLYGPLEVSAPSTLSIDHEQPIHGTASLRVVPSFGFVTYEMGSRCAVRLEFVIRASSAFLKDPRTLAMIDAGSRRFILWVNGTTLALMQDQDGNGFPSTSSRELGGELLPDVATTITLEVDATEPAVRSSVRTAEHEVPLHPVDLFLLPHTPPAAVRAVHVGSAPGVKSEPSGTYWIDDVTIE